MAFVFYCSFCSGRLVRSVLPPNFSKYGVAADKVPNNIF
jgi:hypothetical protein